LSRQTSEKSGRCWKRQTRFGAANEPVQKAQKAAAALQYVLHNAGVNLNNYTVDELLPFEAASEAVSYFAGVLFPNTQIWTAPLISRCQTLRQTTTFSASA
jgi:hypothetical protein